MLRIFNGCDLIVMKRIIFKIMLDIYYIIFSIMDILLKEVIGLRVRCFFVGMSI